MQNNHRTNLKSTKEFQIQVSGKSFRVIVDEICEIGNATSSSSSSSNILKLNSGSRMIRERCVNLI